MDTQNNKKTPFNFYPFYRLLLSTTFKRTKAWLQASVHSFLNAAGKKKNFFALGFTAWSQVDITLCQQQCVVTHLVSHTCKVRIGSFAWEMAVQLVFRHFHIAECVRTDQIGKNQRERQTEQRATNVTHHLLPVLPAISQLYDHRRLLEVNDANPKDIVFVRRAAVEGQQKMRNAHVKKPVSVDMRWLHDSPCCSAVQVDITSRATFAFILKLETGLFSQNSHIFKKKNYACMRWYFGGKVGYFAKLQWNAWHGAAQRRTLRYF